MQPTTVARPDDPAGVITILKLSRVNIVVTCADCYRQPNVRQERELLFRPEQAQAMGQEVRAPTARKAGHHDDQTQSTGGDLVRGGRCAAAPPSGRVLARRLPAGQRPRCSVSSCRTRATCIPGGRRQPGIAACKGGDYQRAVILAPSHFAAFHGVAVLEVDAFETPLGTVPVDRAGVEALLSGPSYRSDAEPFQGEHSLEIQLPLLQRVLPNVAVVPALIGDLGDDDLATAASTLARLDDGKTVFVVSSDFVHYGWRFGYLPFAADGPEQVRTGLRGLDMGAITRICSGDAHGLSRVPGGNRRDHLRCPGSGAFGFWKTPSSGGLFLWQLPWRAKPSRSESASAW